MKRSFVSAGVILAGSISSVHAQNYTPPSGGGSGGGVTSVAAGTCLTGGTITTSGTIGLNSPLGTACGGTGTITPGDAAGTGITLTGTWPVETITNSGQTVPVVAGAGISLTGATIANTASLTAGSNITLTGTAPNQTITAAGASGLTTAGTGLTVANAGTVSLITPVSAANGGSGVANTGVLTWTGALTFTDTTGQSFALPAASDTLAGLGTAQTFSQAIVGSLGMTITGGTVSLESTATNHAVNINTGSSTGVTTIGNNSSTLSIGAIATITSTGTATVPSGDLVIAGAATVPGLSATGEGFIGISTTNGLIIEGSGSSNDIELLNSASGLACDIPHSGNGMNCVGQLQAATLNSTGNITSSGSLTVTSAGQLDFSVRGLLTSPAAQKIQLGAADAASPLAQTLLVQNVVAGTSNTAGGTLTLQGSVGTGSGSNGGVIIQTAGTGAAATVQNTQITALAISAGTGATAGTLTAFGPLTLSGLTSSSAAQTGTLCIGTGNAISYDTTTTCLLSDMDLKEYVRRDDIHGLSEVMALRPISYDVKASASPVLHALGRQVGLGAQEVFKVDPRLVSLYANGPKKGKPSGVRYEQMVAVLVKAVQEQQAEIDALKARK